jgi:hypothetical protein
MINLSKSQYIRGLQCVKSLWLYKHKRDTAITPPDTSAQKVFDTGTRVGELACQLFPDGERIAFEGTSFDEKIERTKELIDNGTQTIYEATFNFDGILVMVDILHKGSNGWEIYEVKSSGWNDKKTLKDIEKYINDISVQYYVLKGSGLDVTKCSVTLLNSSYVFQDTLEIEKLFTHVDVTQEVEEMQVDIPTYLKTFRTYLADSLTEPNIDIGTHCFKPYDCDAYHYCWKVQRNIPDYSVFDIFNMGKKPLELYKNGIVNVEEIPDEAITTDTQRFIVDSWLYKATHNDTDAIKTFFETLRYPIYHLDFETYMDAVPSFNGQKPFQQMPFQYSLHIEHENAPLDHKKFLGDEGTDPREEFIKRLIDDIPADACVLVYNENFEKTRLKELAKDFPLYEAKLMMIHDNVIDLAEPFRKKHYYNYTLKGKYSIKLIMPLMVPEMADAYKKLALVQNGGDAMNTFPALIHMEPQQREAYREALLKYWELDTLSMVKILEKLREHVK